MEITEKFKEREIPYDTLEKFGISREMVDDFPQKVMFDFLSARQTPVLPISVEDEDGAHVMTKARLALKRNAEGNAEVYFMPVLEKSNIDIYEQQQQQQLKEGRAIIAGNPKNEKDGEKYFIQYDKDTNQVVSVPTPVIARNIKLLTDSFSMEGEDIQKLQNGDILTMQTTEGDKISFGVDLLSKTGIRISDGGPREWIENGKDMEKYNFGLYGCWIADDKDGMKYITEDNYTEDIKLEQKLAGQKNMESAQSKGIHA